MEVREREREKKEKGRREKQRLPFQKKAGQRKRKRGGARSACLSRKGEIGGEWSLSLKGRGCLSDRKGQQNYNRHVFTIVLFKKNTMTECPRRLRESSKDGRESL